MLEKILFKAGKEIVILISGGSYWICMFVALGGLLAYLIGFKKGIKYSVASTVIFVLITMLI